MKNLNKANKNTRSTNKSAIRKGKYAPLSYFEYYDDETKTFGRLNSTMCDENGTPIITYKQFNTTANIYAHLDYSSKLSSANAMIAGLGLNA